MKLKIKEFILTAILRLMFILFFPFALIFYVCQAIFVMFASLIDNLVFYVKTVIDMDVDERK